MLFDIDLNDGSSVTYNTLDNTNTVEIMVNLPSSGSDGYFIYSQRLRTAVLGKVSDPTFSFPLFISHTNSEHTPFISFHECLGTSIVLLGLGEDKKIVEITRIGGELEEGRSVEASDKVFHF